MVGFLGFGSVGRAAFSWRRQSGSGSEGLGVPGFRAQRLKALTVEVEGLRVSGFEGSRVNPKY